MEDVHIRPPAVAGAFYPGDATELADTVSSMIKGTAVAPVTSKALIVPHAGYVYSGLVAASGYALLAPLSGRIRRVVLLGPAHRVAVHGLAAPVSTSFRTPLGLVPIDREAIESALRLPQVNVGEVAHAHEHSLEVQLPFLQAALGDFSLAPLIVGAASPHEVAEVLELLWGGPETLIVISSDLSHYRPYAEAHRIDENTTDDILNLRILSHHEQACGATPINGLIEVARRKGLRPTLLDLKNSGDTAGDRSRVVGYCAIAFEES